MVFLISERKSGVVPNLGAAGYARRLLRCFNLKADGTILLRRQGDVNAQPLIGDDNLPRKDKVSRASRFHVRN